MLSINDILLFVDVARSLNFSTAEKKHHMTPAAISKRISYMEKNLQVQLLLRSTRKLVLTNIGEKFFADCEKINFDMQQAFSAISDMQDVVAGNITVSAPTNFSNLILAPSIALFQQQYPKVHFTILLDDVRGKLPNLGTYDLAIRSGTLHNLNVICRNLLTIKFKLCAAESYLKKHGTPKHPEDLKHHNCLDYDFRESGKIWTFSQDHKTIKITADGSVKSNNSLFLKHIALKGGGIVYIPEFMVKEEISHGLLTSLLEEYCTYTMPVLLLHPYSREYLPKRVRLFMDFLVEYVKNC